MRVFIERNLDMTLTTNTNQLERDRLARRAAVRQKMAAATMTEEHIGLQGGELNRIDGEVDQAADAHQTACSVLQVELTALEEQAVARITDRQPRNEAEDNRRAEIVAEIAAHNGELETVIQRAKAMRKPILREIAKLKEGHMSPKVLALELAKDNTADPELLVERFVNSRTGTYAAARADTARKSLKITSYNLQEITAHRMSGDLAACRRHVAQWQAEIEAAAKVAAESNREGERIHQAMVAE